MKKSASKLPLLVTGVIFTVSCASAQQITYKKNYGFFDNEQGTYVSQTFDGGYIIAGTDISFTNLQNQYVIKTDSSGNTEWEKTYGGNYGDAAHQIIQTTDSGYVFIGYETIGGADSDISLVKLDKQGDTLWTKLYGTTATASEYGYSVAQTFDGGYIVTGYIFNGANVHDIYLLKTDAQGDSVWAKTFGGSGTDVGFSVQQTSDSGYIVAGITFLAGDDIFLIKTDTNGDTIWTKTFQDGGWGSCDVRQTSDGGYVVVGANEPAAPDWLRGTYIIKTDANGDTLWTKSYGELNDYWVEGYTIRETNDGGYIIGGSFFDFWQGFIHLHLMKTDSNGDTLWTRVFYGVDGYAYNYGRCAQQTKDGGYVLAGHRYMGALMEYDVYVIKTDSLGNVYPIIGIEAQLAENDLQMVVYPNPFNESATVRIFGNEQELSNAELVVYDITGRKTKSYVVNKLQERLTIQRNEIGAGIFFVQLRNEGEVLDTKKIVVLR